MDAIRLGGLEDRTKNRLRLLHVKTQYIRSQCSNAFQRIKSVYWIVAVYLSIVASVAVYDMILTVQYWRSLKEMEENPIGRWLMNLDRIPDGVMPNLTLFIALKAIGTIVVLATIVMLVTKRARIGHPVAVGVSSFQLGLAAYLTYALNS